MLRSLRELTGRLPWREDRTAAVALGLSLAVLSGVVYFRRIALPADGDYSLHVLFAQRLYAGTIDEIPLYTLAHPGLQLVLAAMHYVTLEGLGFYASLMVVQVAAQVATGLILYFWMGDELGGRFRFARAAVSGALTLAAPLMLLALGDGLFYFGYVGLANYHNPTIHVLRPLALPSFILACRALAGRRYSALAVGAAAILMVASLLVKPNFALCILPAILVLAWVRRRRDRPVDGRILTLGFFLPAAIVLAAQWAIGYWLARGEEVGLLLQPFEVERAFSGNLLPKLLLSVAFPVVVFVTHPKESLKDEASSLAWLALGFGLVQMYFLAEAGDRFYHANFRWGAQISLFLLFASSALLLLRVRSVSAGTPDRRWLLCWVIFAAHVLAGAAYFVRALTSATYA